MVSADHRLIAAEGAWYQDSMKQMLWLVQGGLYNLSIRNQLTIVSVSQNDGRSDNVRSSMIGYSDWFMMVYMTRQLVINWEPYQPAKIDDWSDCPLIVHWVLVYGDLVCCQWNTISEMTKNSHSDWFLIDWWTDDRWKLVSVLA